MAAPRHVFRIHIRATPEEVWRAITDPEFTRQYFHHTDFESTLEPGSPMRYVMADGSDAVVGEIEEVDPPHRLVMTWRALYDAAMADEPPSRVEWLLDDGGEGVTQVTTIHRDLALSPVTSASVGAGWIWILDSMKSLLETGAPLPGAEPERAPVEDADGEWHRAMGVEANNSTWELLEREDLSPDEVDDLLGRAYASTYHWRRAARRGPGEPGAGGRGSCPASTPCSATVSSPSTMRTAARRSWPRPGWRTSTSPTPMRHGPAPSPASAARRGAGGAGRGRRRPHRRRRGPQDLRRRPRRRPVVRPHRRLRVTRPRTAAVGTVGS